MFRRLVGALTTAAVPVRLQRAAADALPVEDGWADTVVSTLVLCSVPDQASAVAEARRVLRPGGQLLFYEHVRAADGGLARWQDRLERTWGVFTGGCHPNRDTIDAIESAGFKKVLIEMFDLPGTGLARPHVSGMGGRGERVESRSCRPTLYSAISPA